MEEESSKDDKDGERSEQREHPTSELPETLERRREEDQSDRVQDPDVDRDQLLLTIDREDRMDTSVEDQRSDSTVVMLDSSDGESKESANLNSDSESRVIAQATDSIQAQSGSHNVELTDYVRVKTYRDSLYTVPHSATSAPIEILGTGNLRNRGDERYRLTHVWTDNNYRQNISTSFDLNTWECRSCKEKHDIRDSAGRAVIVASDQCFVPALPTYNGGSCIGIIRVEDCNVHELQGLLKEKIVRNVARGSTILICSGTELARIGAPTYLSNVAAVLGELHRYLPVGCHVGHSPFTNMVDTADGPWLAAIGVVYGWLDRASRVDSGNNSVIYCTKAHRAMIEELKRNGGEARHSTASRAIMPVSFLNRVPTAYQMGGEAGTAMPSRVTGFTQHQESRILSDMIVELLDKYSHDLSAALRIGRSSDLVDETDQNTEKTHRVDPERRLLLYNSRRQSGGPNSRQRCKQRGGHPLHRNADREPGKRRRDKKKDRRSRREAA